MILIFLLLSAGCYFGVYRVTRLNHANLTNIKPALTALLLGWAGFNFFLGILILFDRIEANSALTLSGIGVSVTATLLVCIINLIASPLFIVRIWMGFQSRR